MGRGTCVVCVMHEHALALGLTTPLLHWLCISVHLPTPAVHIVVNIRQSLLYGDTYICDKGGWL